MLSSTTKWWILNILHIETLFYLALVLAIIYFWWTRKSGIFNHFVKLKEDGLDEFISQNSSPTNTISQHSFLLPKKKRKLNKNEERCREIFQKYFRAKFKSVRPDWLKNPVTGQNLELDGFNPDIKTPIGVGLAFEYDGEQHSKYNSHFHKFGPKEFEYQVKKDTWKEIRCKQEGVLLIRIPYFVSFYDLENYITQKLKRHNLYPTNPVRSMYD